jgi:hypothetical protein
MGSSSARKSSRSSRKSRRSNRYQKPTPKKDNGTSRYFKKTSAPSIASTPPANHSTQMQKARLVTPVKPNSKPKSKPAVEVSTAPAPKITKVETPKVSTGRASKITAASSNASYGVLRSNTNAKKTGDTDPKRIVKSALKPPMKAPIQNLADKLDNQPVNEDYFNAKAAESNKSATSLKPKQPSKPIPALIAKPGKVNEPVAKPSILDKVKASTDVVKPKTTKAKVKPPIAPKVKATPVKEPTPAPANNIPTLIAKPGKVNEPVKKASLFNPAEVVRKATTPAPKPDLPVDMDTYNSMANKQKEGGLLGKVSPTMGAVVKDKYRNDEMSYNQAYWAARKAGGATQTEMAAEQKKIGMKKAYSGDVVVTESKKREAAKALEPVGGKDAPFTPDMLTKGIRTVDTKKTGLFGEKEEKTMTYGDGAVITKKTTDPVIGNVRLGDKKTTTYTNGIEQYTETGGDKNNVGAKVTGPGDTPSQIDDRVKAETVTKADISAIDKQISQEKDPVKLKELHRRRLALMRSMRTQTRFNGLLSDADVKRANLMGIL